MVVFLQQHHLERWVHKIGGEKMPKSKDNFQSRAHAASSAAADVAAHTQRLRAGNGTTESGEVGGSSVGVRSL